MRQRLIAAVTAAALALCQAPSAWADNAMGYRLLSAQDVAALPHNHGAIGLVVERAQVMTDSGLTFDIMRVKTARPDGAGAQAGIKVGDQIIAVDGRVFQSIAAFAAYVGSVTPGSQAAFDTIPAGGGPQQAERVTVTIGAAGAAPTSSAAPVPAPAASTGLSTGTKVAIGVGAVALLGCYEMGCFNHRKAKPAASSPVVQQNQASGQQH